MRSLHPGTTHVTRPDIYTSSMWAMGNRRRFLAEAVTVLVLLLLLLRQTVSDSDSCTIALRIVATISRSSSGPDSSSFVCVCVCVCDRFSFPLSAALLCVFLTIIRSTPVLALCSSLRASVSFRIVSYRIFSDRSTCMTVADSVCVCVCVCMMLVWSA